MNLNLEKSFKDKVKQITIVRKLNELGIREYFLKKNAYAQNRTGTSGSLLLLMRVCFYKFM